MKTRNIWMGIALLLSVLLLATCGGDSGTTPAPAPAPPPAPAPAPAPAPEPEPEEPMTATYHITYAPHYSGNALFQALGAQPYPVEGTQASPEIAFFAYPLDAPLWEEGGMASEGLEHLAYDGHAHDLAHEAEEMGWPVYAESFDEIVTLLQTDPHIELSLEFPCISYAQRLSPSPDWFIGFNACAAHEDDGELHWEETLTVRVEVYDAGVRDGEPYMAATGTSDPQESITRVMTPPWDTEAISTITGTLEEE